MSGDDMESRATAVEGPPRIFMSYRRDDSQGFARSIHDRLALHFGADAVFRDVNDIEPGLPWEDAIDAALATCDVFVLLIGPHWLDTTDDEGHRRLDDPDDRHRREIETAIGRKVRIFIALMEDAHMPRRKQLPQAAPGEEGSGIQRVSALHALRIVDHAFDYGIEELIANIERAAGQARESEEERRRREAEDAQHKAAAEREAEEQRRAEEERRKRAEAEAAERQRAEEEERRRAEEEPTRAEEEPVTTYRPEGQRRRLLILAGIGLGALAVVVAVVLLSGSGEDGGVATVGDPITVGDKPVNVAFGPGGLWVANRNGGSVSLVGGDPPQVKDDQELGGAPEGIATDGESVFVSDGAGDSLWVLDAEGDVIDDIRVDLRPGGIALDEEALWVANSDSDTVSRVVAEGDPQSIGVGNLPYGVATGAGAVWVTNRDDGTVSQIPTGTRQVDETIDVGANPRGIAVSEEGVWVANTDDNTVSRIDLESLTADDTISVGDEPRGVVFAFGSVWVTNGGSDSVSRIDPDEAEVIDTIGVGASPEGISEGPGGVWVANGEDNTVVRIRP